MRRAPVVTTLTLAAFFLSVSVVPALAAGPDFPPTAPAASPGGTTLRASIDRAATQAALEVPTAGQRRSPRVFKSRKQGGGGGSMMMTTLLVTAASLVGTYFVMKELKKQTDELTTSAQ